MQPLHNTPEDPYDEARIVQLLDHVQRLGVSTVGVDIHWAWIEDVSPNPWNSVTTHRLEFFLNEATRRGLSVLATVLETPCWASSDPLKDCTATPSYIYNSAYPPLNSQTYANFIRKLAQRYGYQIDYWQIWNEPNLRYFLIDPDAQAYTGLLQAAYPVLKAEDPTSVVLGGALAPWENSLDNAPTLSYLDDMYAAGARGYFDALAYHPYTDGFPPDYYDPGWPIHSFSHSIPLIRQHMLAHGDSSPIWITESGWTTVENCSNCSWQPELPVSEAEQAAYLIQAVNIARAWGFVDGYLYYSLVDRRNPDPTDWRDHFGLLRADLTAKPAWLALRQLIYPHSNFLPVVLR